MHIYSSALACTALQSQFALKLYNLWDLWHNWEDSYSGRLFWNNCVLYRSTYRPIRWPYVTSTSQPVNCLTTPRCLVNKAPKCLSDQVRSLPSAADTYTCMISQPASTDCAALSANYIRPSDFLCCWRDSLELTTDWVSWSVSFGD